ncbi:MAG: hypothetical protein IPP47_07345 [Bryobacterales bacterium]|nr:hypothetical protein [Bryobacterales bacterium]
MRRMFQRLAMPAFLSLVCCTAHAQQPQDYLRLSVGKKWTLRSSAVGSPIIFEVLEEQGGAYKLKFENPWITSQLTLVQGDGQISVTGLSMGGGSVTMPANTVYWDFTAEKGKRWSNAIGEMTVLARDKTVTTPSGTYQNCIVIQERNKKGDKMFWTFAPNVGFVQFGEGSGAFFLESRSSGPAPRPAGANSGNAGVTRPSQPVGQGGNGRPRMASPVSQSSLLIALAANPAANEGFSPKTVNDRFQMAVNAGVNYIYISPKWNEIESAKGRFKWSDVDYQAMQAADKNMPIILHIRVIDTNQRSMPSDLMRKSLRDDQVRDRLISAAEEALSRCRGRAQHLLIGNEVDSYFKSNSGDIADYQALYASVAGRLKASHPGLQMSLSIGGGGIDMVDGPLKPLMDQTDFFAITYYPLTPDFRAKDKSVVRGDFQRYVQAAKGKRVLLQEVGYPTAGVNGSDENRQAEMFATILDELKAQGSGKFIGANFCFMSDFSDSLVKSFSGYYGMPNAENFKGFLKTLGMFDDNGKPKKAWAVWSGKVRAITGRP